VYMLIVSFSWGISFISPASFDTYAQCEYHAEQVKELRLKNSIGRPHIIVTCEQKVTSK